VNHKHRPPDRQLLSDTVLPGEKIMLLEIIMTMQSRNDTKS